jgi:hypothetical protein
MSTKLWKLLRLTAKTEEELKEKYRKIYLDEYVNKEHYDWLGNRVLFHRLTFDHAFSSSSNYRFSYGNHDNLFCEKRARHILWIKEVLQATAGTIERRHEVVKDSRNRIKKRRVLCVIEEKFVVILDEKEANIMEFVTIFLADKNWYTKVFKKKPLIEIKKGI